MSQTQKKTLVSISKTFEETFKGHFKNIGVLMASAKDSAETTQRVFKSLEGKRDGEVRIDHLRYAINGINLLEQQTILLLMVLHDAIIDFKEMFRLHEISSVKIEKMKTEIRRMRRKRIEVGLQVSREYEETLRHIKSLIESAKKATSSYIT